MLIELTIHVLICELTRMKRDKNQNKNFCSSPPNLKQRDFYPSSCHTQGGVHS